MNFMYNYEDEIELTEEKLNLIERYFKEALKRIKEKKLNEANDQISKAIDLNPLDQNLYETKESIEKIIITFEKYKNIVENAKTEINNKNFDLSKKLLTAALELYFNLSEDNKVTSLLKDANVKIENLISIEIVYDLINQKLYYKDSSGLELIDEKTKRINDIYEESIKLVRNMEFTTALKKINEAIDINTSNKKLNETKAILLKISDNIEMYHLYISDGTRYLKNRDLEISKLMFNLALKKYMSITLDKDVVRFFNEVGISLINFEKYGQSEIDNYLNLIEQKLDLNYKNEDQDNLLQVQINIFRSIRSMQFSKAEDETSIALKKYNSTKLKKIKRLLEEINLNQNKFLNLIKQGNLCLLEKNNVKAKENFDQALDVYLNLLCDDEIFELFREANLDVNNYKNKGKNEIEKYSKLIECNKEENEKVQKLYDDGLNAIRKNLDYKRALKCFKNIHESRSSIFNLQEEIECLKKSLKNIDKYFELISQGVDLVAKNEFDNALNLFKNASDVYLEMTEDETFIKLHAEDLSLYKNGDKTKIYIEDTLEKKRLFLENFFFKS